ncbi:DUF1848 domain-containing protein [uncultured Desulfobacter sp.]|uniref:DUF1848 domain-containing protein n=1 Tax=uncultured Desulfobacter sp. TaxID=240139 RepID=UPI002AAC1794|nr:DUF1848 domain-containing protein [uncultured Desulfobacter sp.]
MEGPTGILSASRRTDIPGWYTPWFLDRIEQGYFLVTNPFNRQSRRINATPRDIHTIVFWSKNYGPFLDLRAHKLLAQKDFHLFFNFTINTPLKDLEPGLPDLSERLSQARRIAMATSPEQVAWRFDPICFYEKGGRVFNNLDSFEYIAEELSQVGIKQCITSFYDPYKKVTARIKRMADPRRPGLRFIDPGTARKAEIIRSMIQCLKSLGMRLFLCCEKELMDAAGLGRDASGSACINGNLYKTLFGGNPETRGDYGQRRKKGCQCTKSFDIGSYEDHPCFHNCLFCYARTGLDLIKPAMG